MEKVLVIDFGGQYNQLIARRVRDLNVYAEIKPYNKITVNEIKESGYIGIIFTGGPNSVYDEKSPHFDKNILDIGIPILGICYGCQLIAYMAGGTIESAGSISEYGKATLKISNSILYDDVPLTSTCWMSHSDYVSKLPAGFIATGETETCNSASFENTAKKVYGVQFHPEVTHTEYGKVIIKNFLYKICNAKGDWVVEDYSSVLIKEYRERLKGKKVICALSGGVDSAVAAKIIHEAIGNDLTCIFCDHGLLRLGEGDMVETEMKKRLNMNIVRVNSEDRFLNKLKGVVEPEQKRKIIGEEFIRVFEEEAKKIGSIYGLVQGTIYPDVIESGKGEAATIKSHHNVGGLPKNLDFEEIIEPLRNLFKDEVRRIGKKLGLPDKIVNRQPFPGPGLAIRVIGEITKEKLEILKLADAIFTEEIEKSNIKELPNQYFAVLTNTKTVGVMGDYRTYGYTIALRAVITTDFMTADFAKIPYEILAKISNRITGEVQNVGRVVYDISSKPPATIEWE